MTNPLESGYKFKSVDFWFLLMLFNVIIFAITPGVIIINTLALIGCIVAFFIEERRGRIND